MIGIYKITNPNGRIYIGQSSNLVNRINGYKKQYVSVKKQTLLYRSFKKYGIDNHMFEIKELCLIEQLNERERYWQDYYNVLDGGLNCILTTTKCRSGKMSQQTKDRIGKANKGKKLTYKQIEYMKKRRGENHHSFGVPRSESFKKNISIKMKEIMSKPENKLRTSLINKGKNLSYETKKKISISKLGKRMGAENNKSVLVLNLDTGIFYDTILEASIYHNINRYTLTNMLSGHRKNSTNMVKA